MITERDIEVLCALDRYYVLSRPQIQRLCFTDDSNGRITRRRLQALVSERLINRHHLSVYSPSAGTPGPAYFPSLKGCEFLAEHFDDERYLAGSSRTPHAHHLFHWLALSETHLAFDEAIARQQEVQIDGWLNEWDICNKDESAPEKRFRLYTLLTERPRLVCAPDAAFLLTLRGHAKVFYLEIDRATSGVRQIAASKTPGYAEMATRQSHRRHFPAATVPTFSVLMVAPTERRREALQKALRGKPGSDLWKFASITDLLPERLLHEPIFHPCDGDPTPLVKPTVPASPAAPIELTIADPVGETKQ